MTASPYVALLPVGAVMGLALVFLVMFARTQKDKGPMFYAPTSYSPYSFIVT